MKAFVFEKGEVQAVSLPLIIPWFSHYNGGKTQETPAYRPNVRCSSSYQCGRLVTVGLDWPADFHLLSIKALGD